jgi:hypothetical protein
MLAQNHDLHGGKNPAHLPRRLQTIQAGHADVHYDYVRLKFFGFRDGVHAVDAFAANIVARSHQKRSNTLADDFVVIDD